MTNFGMLVQQSESICLDLSGWKIRGPFAGYLKTLSEPDLTWNVEHSGWLFQVANDYGGDCGFGGIAGVIDHDELKLVFTDGKRLLRRQLDGDVGRVGRLRTRRDGPAGV